MWMVGCRGGDVAPVVENLRYVGAMDFTIEVDVGAVI